MHLADPIEGHVRERLVTGHVGESLVRAGQDVTFGGILRLVSAGTRAKNVTLL